HTGKLVPAAALGLLVGTALAIHETWAAHQPWFVRGALGVVVLLGFCLVSALVMKATFIELSRLRPARTREIRAGLLRHVVQLFLAQLLTAGALGAILFGLRKLPIWLSADLGWPDSLVAPALVISLVWEVACWPLGALLLLVGSFVVIEDCSF